MAKSKKYTFNPLCADAKVSVRGREVTIHNLTDEDATFMINRGVYGSLIMTIEEAKNIKAPVKRTRKNKSGKN